MMQCESVRPSNDEAVHPIRALARRSEDLSQCINKITSTTGISFRLPYDDNDIAKKLKIEFQDLCFRATEYFDVYEQGIFTQYFKRYKKDGMKERIGSFQNTVKKRRSSWAMICNKIKHNSNIIAPITAHYPLRMLSLHGFSLLRPKGIDSFDFNSDFHKKSDNKRSYITSIKKLISDIICTEYACIKIFSEVHKTLSPDILNLAKVTLPISNSLTNIQAWPNIRFPTEPPNQDTFSKDNQRLTATQTLAGVIPETARMTMLHSGDGFAKSFIIPR